MTTSEGGQVPAPPTRTTTSSGTPRPASATPCAWRPTADAERADDNELVEFFRKAQADSRKGAELGKQMLRSRLGS